MRTKGYLSLGAAISAIMLAGCSGGSDSGGNGALSVSLMDAPADNVTQVQVQITGLWLKGPGGPATKLPLASPTITVDLLDHATEGTAAVLLDSVSIPAGKYEWLEMEVNAEFDNVFDSFVMTTAGGQEELQVPSRRLRLVSGFDVGNLDWNYLTDGLPFVVSGRLVR